MGLNSYAIVGNAIVQENCAACAAHQQLQVKMLGASTAGVDIGTSLGAY